MIEHKYRNKRKYKTLIKISIHLKVLKKMVISPLKVLILGKVLDLVEEDSKNSNY